eukprot:CAMPEP_0194363424 /NCGR_PEP_ID=MMETSP0174-20130528/11215_1 /TAXON_ID=216777 /ORGANISM="Proboscia alata, Strain PI-D3" /LENGTH=518 /DNA_ID=CAMNT_0039136811 /DNA_START=315 /DNA_END=1871 /DNA_ORIENTATION=-
MVSIQHQHTRSKRLIAILFFTIFLSVATYIPSVAKADEGSRVPQFSIGRKIKHSRRLLRRKVRKSIFHQRVGWERVRHGIRNGVGLGVGTAVAFWGDTNPRMRAIRSVSHGAGDFTVNAGDLHITFSAGDKTSGAAVGGLSTALIVSQIGWELSGLFLGDEDDDDKDLIPFANPWMKDLFAIGLGGAVWKIVTLTSTPAGKAAALLLDKYVSPMFLVWSIFGTFEQLIRDHDEESETFMEKMKDFGEDHFGIDDGENEQLTELRIVVSSITSSLATLAIIHFLGKVPYELAASAIAGSTLVTSSMASIWEGNWLRFVEVAIFKVFPLAIKLFWSTLGLLHRIWEIAWKPLQKLFSLLHKLDLVYEENVPQSIQNFLINLRETITKWYNAATKFIETLQSPMKNGIKAVKEFFLANMFVLLPWAIATCGVSFQMKWITSFHDVKTMLKYLIFPGSLVKAIQKSIQDQEWWKLNAKISKVMKLLEPTWLKEYGIDIGNWFLKIYAVIQYVKNKLFFWRKN